MKKLFNPYADDKVRKLRHGDSTNILNLADIQFQIPIKNFLGQYANNWLPQEVSNMLEDKQQYMNILTNEERKAYNLILSYLVFLDSVQTNNLPNIAEFITSFLVAFLFPDKIFLKIVVCINMAF